MELSDVAEEAKICGHDNDDIKPEARDKERGSEKAPQLHAVIGEHRVIHDKVVGSVCDP